MFKKAIALLALAMFSISLFAACGGSEPAPAAPTGPAGQEDSPQIAE